ncbi:hypothetical protein BCY86_04860 [Pajaroellobacter abortibovis]|uniref:HTH marR-type domain-containing protein n=2 Tax=Pajaroellobacter abortibovis TaxID=1882918 RepID=A0A1L6MX09_9BACT|nr:hypothetical protein BCY86_04860 [Pajaroellobacter abortibovis]
MYHVTPQQVEALQAISAYRALSTSMLAMYIGIDPSTASRNLAGLERAGYVMRKKAKNDARQTEVYLTPRGTRIILRFEEGFSKKLHMVFAQFSGEEQQQILQSLEHLVEILRPRDERASIG